MTRPLRIPLFPLDVVLFPGMALPLHIFEPRYKEMTRRCLSEHLEFGIVLILAEGTASVGCTAEIDRVIREYRDGRMDILTAGWSVFSILEVVEEKSYLEASVEFRVDDATAGPPELQEDLLRLAEACRTMIQNEAGARFEPHSGIPLSYQILAALPLELEYKQELLEMGAEAERRQTLRRHLKQWLPQLGHAERVRHRAGGNGHGLS